MTTGMRRDLLVVFVVALLLRAVAAALVPWAPYLDASYYTVVAENLAAGNGFNVPVLWSFLEVGSRIPADASLPIPSNAHWPPLGPLAAAAGMAVLGPSWTAGQVPMVLVSALLPPLTYLVAWELFGRRSVAIGSAILALFPGPLFVFYPMVDNFALMGLFGTLALYGSMRAVRSAHPGRWLLLAGVATGLATLTRIDGVVLALAPATAWLVGRGWTPWRSIGGRPSWLAGFATAAAFFLVVSPWLVRQALVFGAALPSAGGHTLWITSYNEQFSIGRDVTLATYLEWGWANIIGSKLASWVTIVGRTLILLGGFLVVPFIGGLIAFRRRPELAPFVVYFTAIFLLMGGVFTFHAPQGAWYHSAPAWLGFAYPIALAGIAPTFTFLGRWWRFLARARTHAFLAVCGVVAAVVLSVVGSVSLYAGWVSTHARNEDAAAFLREHAARDDVVMHRDAAALHLLTGNPSIAIPYDPLPVIGEAARAYDVAWLVVTRLEGEPEAPLGLWDGGSAVDAAGNRADFLAPEPAFATDSVRIFEVVQP